MSSRFTASRFTASRFTGRTEQLTTIATALGEAAPGPVIVTGEPGSGRSALLHRALELTDGARDAVVAVAPVTGPAAGPGRAAVVAATARARAAGRRPVLVLDDAHLAAPAVVRTLRDLHREYNAVILASAPAGVADNLDCLRYEPGLRLVRLGPLSEAEVGAMLRGPAGTPMRPATAAALHAATAGRPALLAELLAALHTGAATRDRDDSADPGGPWRPGELPDLRGRLSEEGERQLTAALDRAWQGLALDRAAELTRLALAAGLTDAAAPVRAFLLLVAGRADEGLAFLDGLADGAWQGRTGQRLVLTRALLLALGLRQTGRAGEALASAVEDGTLSAPRAAAYRAWLQAVTGDLHGAAWTLDGFQADDDPQTTLFARAALAAVALGTERPAQAVFDLRRAVIAAGQVRAELPWLEPLLTASMIDAALLAGRISEAMTLSAEFHAAAEGRDWDAAVALLSVLNTPAPTAGRPERPGVR
ncbi:hypothetical protein [Kitasatospora sp. NPDC005856]|uniref:hypothetical protein n=1 Tax=Kitasatospora sp. NPDC005856 TaxID=3154566 RepID=UPI0033DC1F91